METEKHSKKKRTKQRGGLFAKILPHGKAASVTFVVMQAVALFFLATLTLTDILPTQLVMTLIVVLLVSLLLSRILLGGKKKYVRIVGIIVAVLFISAFGLGTYFLGSAYAALAKISGGSDSESSVTSNIDVTQDSFNVYITGIDQWESEKDLDLERSDVNMIVTVCPKTNKVLLTSIPRDTYVKLHTVGAMDKLTHTGIYGVDETINTVEDWLGIDLNYYFKMNFNAVCDTIDAIGGVDIYSPIEFVPTKREWYTVKKGWNHMSGREALAFARERKAFEDGDAARVENQQKVVDAVIKKMTTSPALLLNYSEILNAASSNTQTNMPRRSIQDLVKSQLVSAGEWKVESQKIEGEYDKDYVASLTQSMKFDIYRPNEDSVEAVKRKIDETMNPSEEEVEAATEKKYRNFLQNYYKQFVDKINKPLSFSSL